MKTNLNKLNLYLQFQTDILTEFVPYISTIYHYTIYLIYLLYDYIFLSLEFAKLLVFHPATAADKARARLNRLCPQIKCNLSNFVALCFYILF